MLCWKQRHSNDLLCLNISVVQAACTEKQGQQCAAISVLLGAAGGWIIKIPNTDGLPGLYRASLCPRPSVLDVMDSIKVAFTNRSEHLLNLYHHIYCALMRVLATALPFTVICAWEMISEEPSLSRVRLTVQKLIKITFLICCIWCAVYITCTGFHFCFVCSDDSLVKAFSRKQGLAFPTQSQVEQVCG